MCLIFLSLYFPLNSLDIFSVQNVTTTYPSIGSSDDSQAILAADPSFKSKKNIGLQTLASKVSKASDCRPFLQK
jgi:hypothetical protein